MAGIKALVIGMGVLLLAGFVVVAVTLFNRATEERTAAPANGVIDLAAGERVIASDVSDRRIVFRIATPTGERVEVRDIESGGLVAEFAIKAKPP